MSGQPSLSRSAATAVIGYEPDAAATPDFRLTSVNVPSPLLRNNWTNPGGRPRGPQFTGTPFQLQSALAPGLGSFSRVVSRYVATKRSRCPSRSKSIHVQPEP